MHVVAGDELVVVHLLAAMVCPSKTMYEGFSSILIVVDDSAVGHFEVMMVDPMVDQMVDPMVDQMVDPSKIKYEGFSSLLVVAGTVFSVVN